MLRGRGQWETGSANGVAVEAAGRSLQFGAEVEQREPETELEKGR